MFRRTQRAAGCSLIELLVVLALIGVVMVLVVPQLLRAFERGSQRRSLADMRAIAGANATYRVDTRSSSPLVPAAPALPAAAVRARPATFAGARDKEGDRYSRPATVGRPSRTETPQSCTRPPRAAATVASASSRC